MVKKTIMAAAMLAISLSAAAQGYKPYTISVTLDNASDGDTLLLAEENGREIAPVDTAVIKSRKAVFTRSDKRYVGSKMIIDLKKGVFLPAQVITTPGASIKVENGAIAPEPNNDLFIKVMAQFNADMKSYPQLTSIINDTASNMGMRLKAMQQIDSVVKIANARCVENIINGMPLPVCGFLLQTMAQQLSESQIDQIYKAMATKMPDDPYYKALKARNDVLAETAEGKPYKEIALFDTKGSMVRLSNVVKANKLTLVDFWASWCRPCLAEMPNVKRVYDAYHGKGLEIYGVSLDENLISWQAAIENLGLGWIQVSDLKGWQSAGARAYSIQSIPATLLIDQSGTIIARNLRGPGLEARISEILK